MWRRKCGTQLAVSSTTPTRRCREALQGPVQDQIGQRNRRSQVQEDRVEQALAVLRLALSPRRVERALELGDVEHRGHTVIAEGRPDRIEVGVGQWLAVHRSRGDHRQADTFGPHPRRSPRPPRRGRAASRARPRRGDPRRQRTRRPRIGCRHGRSPAVRARSDASRLLPEQSVVREHDGCVQPELVERSQARARWTGRCRGPAPRRTPGRGLPGAGGGGRRR